MANESNPIKVRERERRAQLAKWVAESRAKQGLPAKITDPDTLRRIAVLFGRGRTSSQRDEP